MLMLFYPTRGELMFMWFMFGFISAFVLIVVAVFWTDARDKKKKECAEFEEYKRQKKTQSAETVDAQFIEVAPKEKPPSQALVRRSTSLIPNRKDPIKR